jgi:predicted metal-dependent hydrolase
MLENDCNFPLHPEVLRGIELFNAGEYFEAHEALENAWREEPGRIRELYQGILQVAVTYLHIQRGNYSGATKVAARCQIKLDQWPETCRGVDVATLRRNLTAVMEALTRLGPERIRAFEMRMFKKIEVRKEYQ